MPTSPKRRRRGSQKDRFRTARRAMERATRKFHSGQLVFAWFEDPAATSDPAPRQTGRVAT
jgi:hypothetical protein